MARLISRRLLWRLVWIPGSVLLAAALVLAILDAAARPAASDFLVPVGVGVAAGAVLGIIMKFSVPLSTRLGAMRALMPRLARRLLPQEKGRH